MGQRVRPAGGVHEVLLLMVQLLLFVPLGRRSLIARRGVVDGFEVTVGAPAAVLFQGNDVVLRVEDGRALVFLL